MKCMIRVSVGETCFSNCDSFCWLKYIFFLIFSTECQMVMNVLWTRLRETGKDWRYVYKVGYGHILSVKLSDMFIWVHCDAVLPPSIFHLEVIFKWPLYQALAVIEYLVSHGSERAVDDIIEHTFQISVRMIFSTLPLDFVYISSIIWLKLYERVVGLIVYSFLFILHSHSQVLNMSNQVERTWGSMWERKQKILFPF